MRYGASAVTLHLPAVAKMGCLGGILEALASDITVALGAVSDRDLAWATMPLTGDTSYNGSHEVLAGGSSARGRFKRAVEERRIWHPSEHGTHSQG